MDEASLLEGADETTALTITAEQEDDLLNDNEPHEDIIDADKNEASPKGSSTEVSEHSAANSESTSFTSNSPAYNNDIFGLECRMALLFHKAFGDAEKKKKAEEYRRSTTRLSKLYDNHNRKLIEYKGSLNALENQLNHYKEDIRKDSKDTTVPKDEPDVKDVKHKATPSTSNPELVRRLSAPPPPAVSNIQQRVTQQQQQQQNVRQSPRLSNQSHVIRSGVPVNIPAPHPTNHQTPITRMRQMANNQATPQPSQIVNRKRSLDQPPPLNLARPQQSPQLPVHTTYYQQHASTAAVRTQHTNGVVPNGLQHANNMQAAQHAHNMNNMQAARALLHAAQAAMPNAATPIQNAPRVGQLPYSAPGAPGAMRPHGELANPMTAVRPPGAPGAMRPQGELANPMAAVRPPGAQGAMRPPGELANPMTAVRPPIPVMSKVLKQYARVVDATFILPPASVPKARVRINIGPFEQNKDLQYRPSLEIPIDTFVVRNVVKPKVDVLTRINDFDVSKKLTVELKFGVGASWPEDTARVCLFYYVHSRADQEWSRSEIVSVNVADKLADYDYTVKFVMSFGPQYARHPSDIEEIVFVGFVACNSIKWRSKESNLFITPEARHREQMLLRASQATNGRPSLPPQQTPMDVPSRMMAPNAHSAQRHENFEYV